MFIEMVRVLPKNIWVWKFAPYPLPLAVSLVSAHLPTLWMAGGQKLSTVLFLPCAKNTLGTSYSNSLTLMTILVVNTLILLMC